MTLAYQLLAIKKAEGDNQRRLSAEFSAKVKGHPEEKVLRDFLTQAELGRNFLDFGRNPYIPNDLADEGFHIEMAGAGFHCHFD